MPLATAPRTAPPANPSRRALTVALACLPMAASSGLRAQSPWPARPLRLIVPFAAGGGNDAVARTIGERLSQTLGQRVVVDNRGGAGGVVGAELAARAEADGYTLFLGGVGSHAINPALHARLAYDPVRDFAPVCLVATAPLVVAAHPALNVNTMAELSVQARARPGVIEYASNGVGSSSHLAAELYAATAGVRLTHVPYKGLAPALSDLLAGQVRLMFSSLVAILPHFKSGRLRALATTGVKRSPLLADLPTIAETGMAGYRAASWYGILAPAATPREIVLKLNAAIEAALARDDVRATLAAEGAEPVGGKPEAFAAHIHDELERMRTLVRRIGLSAS
jgi:tripartite-type tricarboxylate transporter receptor subunit TctC